MTADSLKRLIMTVLGATVVLVGSKLGLSQGQEAMVTTLLSVFLAQSGVNAAIGKLAASKAGKVIGAVETVAEEVTGALEQGKASAAKGDGAAAGAAPGSPSQG